MKTMPARDRQQWRIMTVGITIGVMAAECPGVYGAKPSSLFAADRVAPSTVADKNHPALRKSPVAGGIVERYLMDPRGEVEGLLLADGTQVHVTSRIAHELTKAIKPGDHVRVHGSRKKGEAVVSPDVIVNITAGASFFVPLRLDLPLPANEDQLSMTPMKAGGRIEVLLYGTKGEVQGMVLSDGTQVRLPPDINDELRHALRIGETVKAEGYGTQNEFGRAMEALAMSADKDTLTPLDPTIRRLP